MFVQLRNIEVTVKSSGYVESEVYEEFVCESCMIEDINVNEGDYVFRDDILFKDIKSKVKIKDIIFIDLILSF